MSFDLKAERLNRGLSIRGLAAEIDVNAAVIQRAEEGKSVHPANAKAIADFYDRKVTDIWPVKEVA